MANWIKYSAFEQKKETYVVKNKVAVLVLSEKMF